MALDCDWVVACDTALVDRRTGRVSLIGVVDRVQVASFPAQLAPFQIVACWHNRTDMVMAARVRIEVIDPAATEPATLAQEDIELSGRVGHRTICIVQAMTVPRPGRYRLLARWRSADGAWHEGAAHPFTVVASVSTAAADAA